MHPRVSSVIQWLTNMKGVSAFIFIAALGCSWAQFQFLNHRPFPMYSLENMPDTMFSCRDKILGGYYADVETMCQMFHICVKVAGVGVQDFRFLCPNGTAFDQDHQICAEWEDVDCDISTLYYSSDNFDLYRIGSGTRTFTFQLHLRLRGVLHTLQEVDWHVMLNSLCRLPVTKTRFTFVAPF
jgi:hypothetical protein